MRWKPRTIRARLTLWFAGGLAIVLVVFSTAIYFLVRSSLLGHVDDRLRHDLEVVQGMLAEYEADPGEIEEHGLAPLYSLVEEGRAVFVSDAWRRQGLPDPVQAASRAGAWSFESPGEHYYAIAASASDPGGLARIVVVATEQHAVRRSLAALGWILALGLPGAIAIACAGGSFLAGRSLSPVGALADAASRITAEKLADRLPVDDREDEFGRLALVFNDMLARLEEGFERVRRFTADASHELRTPLTAMRSVGEVALREGRDPERYEETIVSMLEETDRLTRLVDGLLLLTREDRAAYRKRFERFDLAALVQESVDLLKVLAEEKEQRAVLQLEQETFVTGDRTTLRQAVVNLIDNAIKYTPRGGTIVVSVSMPDASCALIEVADEGPGIPAEHRDRVFERFYRVERDRGRATGGVGLGLAIARWAIELHQGSIELAPESQNGSTFRVRLPVASSARLDAAAEPTIGVPPVSPSGFPGHAAR